MKKSKIFPQIYVTLLTLVNTCQTKADISDGKHNIQKTSDFVINCLFSRIDWKSKFYSIFSFQGLHHMLNKSYENGVRGSPV